MHPKLQQAIVATRSGRKKDAQHLLIDALRTNPEDANAWYLLSQLVESENRQISYLQKTIEIDTGHPKAKQRLMQLGAIPVPAPIFPEDREPKAITPEEVTDPLPEPDEPKVVPDPVSPQPTRVTKQKSRSESAKVDTEWRRTAGQPITEKSTKPTTASQPAKSPTEQTVTSPPETRRISWLTVVLTILLIGILGLFGYWLYLFFFNQF